MTHPLTTDPGPAVAELDTIEGEQLNGNDLNLSFPVALGLQQVPAFGGRLDVTPGSYFLWTEVETKQQWFEA